MNQKAMPAVAADLFGMILFFILITSAVRDRLLFPSVNGGSILFIIFLLTGFGINRLKRLESVEGDGRHWIERFDFTGSQRNMILLALFAVIIFVLSQVEMNNLWGDTVDLFENTGEVHEGEMTLYITFGPIFIWFIAGALYLISFSLPTEKLIGLGTAAYAATEFIALLLINLLMGLYALYFWGWIGRMLPASGPTLTFVAVMIILGLMFIPMRLRHSFKNPQWISLISFLVMLVVLVSLNFSFS